jgi:hypothetical protein
MHRCEIKSISACRRESSSLEAKPLRAATAECWSNSPPRKACFQETPQYLEVAFCSSSPHGLQISSSHRQRNSNTILRLRCILSSGSASSTNVKSPNAKALLALQQSSPAREGSARPNHSVNLRANGIARCPAAAYSAALHPATAGHRAMPSAPGYLER